MACGGVIVCGGDIVLCGGGMVACDGETGLVGKLLLARE